MRIRMIAAVGAVFFAAASLTAPAQAAFSDCDADRVCIWGNNDYAWLIGERPGGEGVANIGGEANNEMDSWGNRTTRRSAGYADRGGVGDCQSFAAGSRDNNVSPVNSDELSSWKTNGGC